MLIAFTGKAGCGKDTAAEFLSDHRGFRHDAFARPLYEAVSVIFDRPVRQFKENRVVKEALIPGFDFSYRKALQTMGTEWRDLLDKELWVKLLARRNMTTPNLVISDLRFQHEINWVKNKGGYIIEIVPAFGPGYTADNPHHVSEAGINPQYVDYKILNDGTLKEYEQVVIGVCDRIISSPSR